MEVGISLLVTIGFLSVFCLFGIFFVSTTILLMQRMPSETILQFDRFLPASFYWKIYNFFFNIHDTETVLLSFISTKQLLNVLYVIFLSSLYFILYPCQTYLCLGIFQLLVFLFFLTVSLVIFSNYIPRLWVLKKDGSALQYSTPLSSFFLCISLPFSYLIVHMIKIFKHKSAFIPYTKSEVSSNEKLLEVIWESYDKNLLSEADKRLLQSVFTFKDRIAREVMAPRTNLFAISYDMPIKEAVLLLEKEGYSRVPVYKNTIDTIIGVVMFKDLLLQCFEIDNSKEKNQLLSLPVDTITSPVLYVPETEKISQILQEFRKKQRHLAIVVDEYGNTAGVITIEDILEELVGEIADEYDEEPSLFYPLGKNAWLVDGKMNLLDLEEELGIKIPQEGEYDTVAGYIFYRLGVIPEKGVVIHHDDFELEILKSSDRMVESVKITPTNTIKQRNLPSVQFKTKKKELS